MGSGGRAQGWYLDPDGVGTLRYWDGEGWTGHVSPKPTRLPAPAAAPAVLPPADLGAPFEAPAAPGVEDRERGDDDRGAAGGVPAPPWSASTARPTGEATGPGPWSVRAPGSPAPVARVESPDHRVESPDRDAARAGADVETAKGGPVDQGPDPAHHAAAAPRRRRRDVLVRGLADGLAITAAVAVAVAIAVAAHDHLTARPRAGGGRGGAPASARGSGPVGQAAAAAAASAAPQAPVSPPVTSPAGTGPAAVAPAGPSPGLAPYLAQADVALTYVSGMKPDLDSSASCAFLLGDGSNWQAARGTLLAAPDRALASDGLSLSRHVDNALKECRAGRSGSTGWASIELDVAAFGAREAQLRTGR